jgi:hypothetical protein
MLLKIIGAMAAVGIAATSCNSILAGRAARAEAEAAAKAQAEADKRITAVREACLAERAALIQRAVAIIDKEPARVHRDLEQCWNALGDTELGALRMRANARMQLHLALDKTASVQTRMDAVHKLEQLDPDEFARRAPLLASLRKAVAAERNAEARAEAAAKRKRGVSIGMTRDDVLASSWGKPRKINTTTTAYAVREQWVYDGGYLYFRDGVLTSIQN